MQNERSLTVPGAIIIAGAIIAIAIIWTVKPETAQNLKANTASLQDSLENVNIKPVTADDHILGNPNATVKIVEYSDPSCPFCKDFNPTMVKIMDEYGPSGKVAWVYRSFPLDKPGTRPDGGILHPNAGIESQALECAAALGGNDKFWKFEKILYEVTPAVTQATPNGLDPSKLPLIAKDVGLDNESFTDCLKTERYKNKVEAQYQDGINAGINGTPTSFIITPSGSKIPIIGAQPYNVVKSTIEALIGSAN